MIIERRMTDCEQNVTNVTHDRKHDQLAVRRTIVYLRVNSRGDNPGICRKSSTPRENCQLMIYEVAHSLSRESRSRVEARGCLRGTANSLNWPRAWRGSGRRWSREPARAPEGNCELRCCTGRAISNWSTWPRKRYGRRRSERYHHPPRDSGRLIDCPSPERLFTREINSNSAAMFLSDLPRIEHRYVPRASAKHDVPR